MIPEKENIPPLDTIPAITEHTFTKDLFWDVRPEQLDWEKNKRQIVERVITRGMLEDWKRIKAICRVQGIADIAKTFRCLDAMTLNFIATVTPTPIEEFRCYTKRQLNPSLWNS